MQPRHVGLPTQSGSLGCTTATAASHDSQPVRRLTAPAARCTRIAESGTLALLSAAPRTAGAIGTLAMRPREASPSGDAPACLPRGGRVVWLNRSAASGLRVSLHGVRYRSSWIDSRRQTRGRLYVRRRWPLLRSCCRGRCSRKARFCRGLLTYGGPGDDSGYSAVGRRSSGRRLAVNTAALQRFRETKRGVGSLLGRRLG